MSLKMRIASFNCENFFSRAILLNRDNLAAKPLLEQFVQLQDELSKTAYDKPRIVALYKALQKFVTVRENKGKLLSGASGTHPKVVAKGRDAWEGFIELRRERISDAGQENTVRVLKEVDADVVCIVEMEDRPTLQAVGIHKSIPAGRRYHHAMLIDGNDDRGIDVGVLSRHPIGALKSHVDDRDAKGEIFSRDCLEAEIQLPGNRRLSVLPNHLKSQGFGSPASNDAKRLRQSTRIAQILQERYDLTKDFVVVAGDLNADRHAANGATLAPLTSNPDLVDVLDTLGVNSWSYAFRGAKQRLDYLLCSKALAVHVTALNIERRGMWDLEKLTGGSQKPFPTVKGQKSAASDHAAVSVDIDLP